MIPPQPKRRSAFADKLAEFDFVGVDERATARRGRWHDFFRDRIGARIPGRIVCEIGCADAATLSSMASKHPHVGFIGLDWKYKQLLAGAERVVAMKLSNVALVRLPARSIRDLFADGEVDELLVFHPEPCDRPEEAANRLLDERFLIDAHRVLRDGRSTLTLKTDHAGYYQWMLAQLGLPEPDWSTPRATRVRMRDLIPRDQMPASVEAITDRFDVIANALDFWHDKAATKYASTSVYAGEVTTFEQRFVRKRQPIFYLVLRKRAQTCRASTS